jgi:MFS family permease
VTDSRVFYGWWVLAAGIAIVAVGMGTLFSLAVFLKPLEEDFGWSRSLIAGIALVNWLIFGGVGFGWGILSDRIGTRRVVGLGAGLLGAALLLSSRATAAWQLYVAFGILGAAGASAFYVPLSATATRWFSARRGLALGLLNAGMGLGIMVGPPLARALTTAYGWRPTMALFGLAAWTVGLLVVPWLYDRPADRGLAPYGDGTGSPTIRRPAPSASAGEALRHPVFWLLAVVHLGCCLAHSGPIFHMVSHAIDLGVPKMAAAAMLGLSGAASIAGRIGSGLLADRFGAKRALVGMLSFQAATLSTYLVAAGELPLFLASLVFGLAYGGAMPLYALVAREFFGERVIGTAFGGIFFVSTIGMGLGAVAGGVVFDRLGSYWSLHLASTLVGAFAVTVALALRPPRAVAAAPVLAGGR